MSATGPVGHRFYGLSTKEYFFLPVPEAEWYSIWDVGGVILFTRMTAGGPEPVWGKADAAMGKRLDAFQKSSVLWESAYVARQADAVFVYEVADQKTRAVVLDDLRAQHQTGEHLWLAK